MPKDVGTKVSELLQARSSLKLDPASKASEDLSRLAFLIDAATSGGTCTAVLKIGETIVISQNRTGKATAQNAGFMIGALNAADHEEEHEEEEHAEEEAEAEEAEEDEERASKLPSALKKPLNENDVPMTVAFGSETIELEATDETGAKHESSARKLAKTHRTNELGFTDPDKKKRYAPQAARDAERRLTKASQYVQNEEIEHIVVHEGANDNKHCEMRILDALHSFIKCGNSLAGIPIVLGISKLCCALCHEGVELFRKLHPGVQLTVQGSHGTMYGSTGGWTLPRFVDENLDQFGGLMASLAEDEQYRAFFPTDEGTKEWPKSLRDGVAMAITRAGGKKKATKANKKKTQDETDRKTKTEYISDNESEENNNSSSSKSKKRKSTKDKEEEQEDEETSLN